MYHNIERIIYAIEIKTQLDFSKISFVCLIAWFAWARLIRLLGLPDCTEQDLSGWNGLPDLPEQDWSGWEGCPICLTRIDDPAQENQACNPLNSFKAPFLLLRLHSLPDYYKLNGRTSKYMKSGTAWFIKQLPIWNEAYVWLIRQVPDQNQASVWLIRQPPK